jgi:hypothetical protein
MNPVIEKSILVVGILLATSSFISCDSRETKKEIASLAIADNSILSSYNTADSYIRKPVVFIAGFDKGGENYYFSARKYFQKKEYEIVEEQYSLEEIILWLNDNVSQVPFGEIHIVNNSNPYKGINLETVVRGEKITTETLRKNIAQGRLPALNNVVTAKSKIVFHVSGLTENTGLMKTLKDAFCDEENPKVIASPYHTIFGGAFSNHYLAQPYYVFYPTANSPGKTDLSKEIAKKYSKEKDIDWYAALNNETERYIGDAYTIQFNLPIVWEFDYHNSDSEIPAFKNQEEIMDWIELQENLSMDLSKYNLPVAKYRWKWSVKNSKLTIKGKTTGLCILKPLTKPYGDLKHIEPDTNNKRLYAIK